MTTCTVQPHFRTDFSPLYAAFTASHPPVTRLETTRGKISIFSILIRISPGKAMIITTSGGRGDMWRRSIPAMEPRNTPVKLRKHTSDKARSHWDNANTHERTLVSKINMLADMWQKKYLIMPIRNVLHITTGHIPSTYMLIFFFLLLCNICQNILSKKNN